MFMLPVETVLTWDVFVLHKTISLVKSKVELLFFSTRESLQENCMATFYQEVTVTEPPAGMCYKTGSFKKYVL